MSSPHYHAKVFINCTARQCWPIGQFRLVLYNQSVFSFEELSSFCQFNFTLFFIGHHLGSNLPERNKTGRITESDLTVRSCIAAIVADSPLTTFRVNAILVFPALVVDGQLLKDHIISFMSRSHFGKVLCLGKQKRSYELQG